MTCTVYLGTHEPAWLPRLTTPLFISRRRIARRKALPRARGRWALDSGGFTELNMHGRWETTAKQYATEVRRWSTEIGGLDWAAAQDWMCEPFVLKKTGSTVLEHQRRTVDNYSELMSLAPDLPWCPVLQGWVPGDYFEHVEMYQRAGFDLTKLERVGLGSVCRRQHTFRVEQLARELTEAGMRLHGFGFKITGLPRVYDVLASSDSLAWSFNARKNPPLPECRGKHASCANCARWAELWLAGVHQKVKAAAETARRQLTLFGTPDPTS